MGTPKGMRSYAPTLQNQDQVFVYYNADHIFLQLRHHVATEENILTPSFKVAVKLTAFEALVLTSKLLALVASRIPAVPDSYE